MALFYLMVVVEVKGSVAKRLKESLEEIKTKDEPKIKSKNCN